ncbi:MAG TPA: universal stress protein [Halococcus sp.]|nr:universal stress protein [Halococcus sp.]
MHQNILVPTDGSAHAALAIEEAFDLASTYDATVHLLYVMDETTRGDGLIGMSGPHPYTKLREIGERAIGKMAMKAEDSGVRVTTEVRPGIPYETIIDYAHENDIDVIIMSSHKRSGVRRFIFGSVTERVVRGTEIPVIVVQRKSASEGDGDTTAETAQESATTG